MFSIQDTDNKITYNFPQTIKEITKENLISLTKNINIPANKAVICICQFCDLFTIRTVVNGSKKGYNIGVIPLLAKCSDKFISEYNCNIGDFALIPSSAIERGIHVNVNTCASYDSLCKLIRENKEFSDDIFKGLVKDEKDNQVDKVYTIEFKIVDCYDIVGTTIKDSKTEDPFKSVVNV